MVSFKWLWVIWISVSISGDVYAATVQRDLDYGPSQIFGSAKRFLLKQNREDRNTSKAEITLEDVSAGIIRFVLEEGKFLEKNGSVEIIELGPRRSRLRVHLPTDFEGRSQLMLEGFLQNLEHDQNSKQGREVPFSAPSVYRSVKRHVLNHYVRTQKQKEHVIATDAEDVGFFRFHFRTSGGAKQEAIVEVIPVLNDRSRVVVLLVDGAPSDQFILEDALLKSVRSDLTATDSQNPLSK